MKKQRFIMNVRYLKRGPAKYQDCERSYYSYNWYYSVEDCRYQRKFVERKPTKEYSWLRRIVRVSDFKKKISGYRNRQYKYFPKLNTYNVGSYKNIYKAHKNPLICRTSY